MESGDASKALAPVIVLVGPKGAGKSTLGRVAERELGAIFLEVEAVAKQVLASRGGAIDEGYARAAFAAIAEAVERLEGDPRAVVIETTGASDATPALLDALRARRPVRLVRVAGREVCEARIASRDASRQVAVPPDLVRAMYERSAALRLPWDLELVNDPPLAAAEAAAALAPLVARGR